MRIAGYSAAVPAYSMVRASHTNEYQHIISLEQRVPAYSMVRASHTNK
ncbi:hypothetical protein [Candidatus Uabimicrobium amorphum]|nr:hypothetical protein [Candidatus Uabimicrobium amorphum]